MTVTPLPLDRVHPSLPFAPSTAAQEAIRRGIDRLQADDRAGALADFHAAAGRDPEWATPWNNAGLVRHMLGQYRAAVADFDQALARQPDYVDALNNRGRAFQALGEFDAAVADFDRALAGTVGEAAVPVLHNRGMLRQQQGELAGALADFDRALAINPRHTTTRIARGLARKQAGESQAVQAGFTGLKALVYADAAPPDPALQRKLTDFAAQGGLLITGPGWPAAGKPAHPDFDTQFDVRALGKGRLALAREAIVDPYQVAVDTQFLLSHRNDLVKIYNSASSGCTRYTAPPDGKKSLLQCLSYADGGRGGLRTIWMHRQYRETRLWTVGAPPARLEPELSEEYIGVEYHLPAGTPQSFLALEFEV